MSCHAPCPPDRDGRGAQLRGHADTWHIRDPSSGGMQGRGPAHPPLVLQACRPEQRRAEPDWRAGLAGASPRELTEPAGPY